MRIIAGSARGRRIALPKGWGGRPTLDRVREALFNLLGQDLSGFAFLDLFAGTGANGLEALSRGAARVVFIERDAKAIESVRSNLATLKLGGSADVRRGTLPGALTGLRGDTFDVVFADPPYKECDYDALLRAVLDAGLVAPGGRFVIEHAAGARVAEAASGWEIVREKRYGDTALTILVPHRDSEATTT